MPPKEKTGPIRHFRIPALAYKLPVFIKCSKFQSN
jgi:hypothetical protein